MNVQNFGQVNLLESEYEFATAEGPIGGLMVPPVPIHQHDGDDVFQVPFDLEGGLLQGGQNLNDEEGWVEAEDDESEYDDGNGTVGRKKARKAMELKSQQSHDSSIHFGLGGMNVDSSALAAVNMTLDSQGTQPLGRQGAREEEEEEEEWHAFDPEEEEEEEENMGHQDFDITMDTDRDVAGRRTKSSDISDIELVRGDDSRDQMSMIGRPSAIGSELSTSFDPLNPSMTTGQDKSQISTNDFPMHVEEEEEEEFEQGGIPFDETADFQPMNSSLISGDGINVAGTNNNKRKSDTMDGLELGLSNDITQEEDEEANRQEKSQPEDQAPEKKKAPRKRNNAKGPQRLRKRRRVEIDNDATELTSDFIKDMLRDTSDIVQQNRCHPAEYTPDEMESNPASSFSEHVPLQPVDSMKKRRQDATMVQIMAALPQETLLARPNCADNGGIHPKLLLVWERNFSRVHGQPLPFQMRGEAGQEQRRERRKNHTQENENAQEEEEVASKGSLSQEEDIELGRHRDDSLGEGRLSMDFPPGEKLMEEEEEQGVEFPSTQDDRDFPLHEQEEEEESPLFEPTDQSGANVTFDLPLSEMNQSPIPSSDQSDRSTAFSLGAVNDLEGETSDLIDEPRQDDDDHDGLQEETATSSTKWHKHTVKVLELLQRNMPVPDKDIGNEEEKDEHDQQQAQPQPTPPQLSYDKLSHGTTRRTACGVFFELLQLKTWDFIELEQDSSFGDILIKPGQRFHEQPPVE